MENSNNDRWSLLANDLGIEIASVKVESDTNKTETASGDKVSRNALIIVPENSVTKIAEPEIETKDVNLTSTTPEILIVPTLTTSPTTNQSTQSISSTTSPPPPPPSTTTSPTDLPNSGNTTFGDQKKKYTVVSSSVKTLDNSSGNFVKPVAVKLPSHSSVNRSSFGAGILEPHEIAEINVTKNMNTTPTTNTPSTANLSGQNNFAPNNPADVSVTKKQIPDSANFQPVEPDMDSRETVKQESIKRSFFGRLQQINFFSSRNRNDNTTKNADGNITTPNATNAPNSSNEYITVDNIDDVQSEREHLPHGRYLPPHAQSLYKAHTQSQPVTMPPQQNTPRPNPTTQSQNTQQNTGKDGFDPLRQIASQISKLGDGSETNTNQKNNTARAENPNRTHDPRYKKSPSHYRYNNSANKAAGYYSGEQNTINASPESLFDDDLPETEEFAAFRRLISDGVSVDEEQRRLASLLGEPKEEPQTPQQQVEPQLDNRVVSYPQNRVIRYPNNRNYGNNNLGNNTKPESHRPENSRPDNSKPENHTDKRWTPPFNDQADKSTVVRGRRGSRFVGNGQKVGNGINSDGANRPNIPPNSGSQQSYQSRQSGVVAGQYWQQTSGGGNESAIPQNIRPAAHTNTRNVKQDQNWRGRRQPDNRTILDPNDPIHYNNSQYQQTSQPQYSDYSSQITNDIGTEDADYIDVYDDGVVSDAERLSFAQSHKNIPSWNDAVESIVDTNIQRHTRHYQNIKRR